MKEYIVGRGSAMAALLTNGAAGAFFPLSNCKTFSFGLAVEMGEHNEAESVNSLLDATWVNKQSGKVEVEALLLMYSVCF